MLCDRGEATSKWGSVARLKPACEFSLERRRACRLLLPFLIGPRVHALEICFLVQNCTEHWYVHAACAIGI